MVGKSRKGGLGLGKEVMETHEFTKVELPCPIEKIDAGDNFNFAVG